MSTLTQERQYLHSVGDEPLPGYRLIGPLGAGGFGEVWKCLAPGGLQKAIKFVSNPDASTSSLEQEHAAFERIKGIRHPFLVTLERVELIGGELIMVMELADKSLANRYEECRAAGLRGIPRDELLSYMVDTAEALDVLGRQHGLQHLDVKPANLFLIGGHVKLGDYGLVSRYQYNEYTASDPEFQSENRGLTPKYVAPEILQNRVDARSDQYTLALVYQELLTGTFPYSGKTAKQLLMQHGSAEPDVSCLPQSDRYPVRKALAKTPEDRFQTCLAFVRSLMQDHGSTATKLSDTMRSSSHTLANALDLVPASSSPRPSQSSIDLVSVTQKSTLGATIRPGSAIQSASADELARACPGWTLTSELEYGPRGRILRATDAKGLPRRVQIIRCDNADPADIEDAIRKLDTAPAELVQGLFHPAPRTFVFTYPDDRNTLLTITKKLAAPGVAPLGRDDAIGLVANLARLLDRGHQHFGHGHGLINPALIGVQGKEVRLDGFGLYPLLQSIRPEREWLADECYLAPEVYSALPLPASDQYSLALIFLHLVGAWTPSVRRQKRGEATWVAPTIQLEDLSRSEAEAIRRAMAKNPNSRFDSCTDFIQALSTSSSGRPNLGDVRLIESWERLQGKKGRLETAPTPLEFVEQLLQTAQASLGGHSLSGSGVVRQADGRIVMRFPSRFTAELAELKLKSFAAQSYSELLVWNANTYAIRPKTRSSSLGSSPPKSGVELVVEMPIRGDQAQVGELVVTGRFVGPEPHKHADVIRTVLDQFRRCVQNAEERRRCPRTKIEWIADVYPVDDDLTVYEPIRASARDLSRNGIGLIVPSDCPHTHAFLTFPTLPQVQGWSILTQIARKQTTGSGQHFLGCQFVHTKS